MDEEGVRLAAAVPALGRVRSNSPLPRELGRDPLSGECFLFVSPQRARAKVLATDGTGQCLYHQRLETGRFASVLGEGDVELTMSGLHRRRNRTAPRAIAP